MTWTEFKEVAWLFSTVAGLLSPLLVWLWKRGETAQSGAAAELRALKAINEQLEAQAVQREIEGIRAEVQSYHTDIRTFTERANDAMSKSKSAEQAVIGFKEQLQRIEVRLVAQEQRHG